MSLRVLHSHPVFCSVWCRQNINLCLYRLSQLNLLHFVFFQVWDPSAVHIADYIRIRIGHGLTPTKATLLLGMVQQFSSSVISEGIYRRLTCSQHIKKIVSLGLSLIAYWNLISVWGSNAFHMLSSRVLPDICSVWK